MMFFRPILIALVLMSCSDDPVQPTPTPVTTTPLTVWVFDEVSVNGLPDAPLANVQVALDSPNKERIIQTTSADGHATFAIDASTTDASISAFSNDHTLVTMLDAAIPRPNTFGKPNTELVIVLPRLDTSLQNVITVSGAITNKQAANDSVFLAASGVRRRGNITTTEPTYSLRAPSNQPFFLIGHEAGVTHIKSFRIDVPAQGVDATQDVDLSATALPTHPLRVRANKPSTFDATTTASLVVESVDSSITLSTFDKITTLPDAFDLQVIVADADITPERTITRTSLRTENNASSTRAELVVADNTSLVDFLSPPTVPDVSRRLDDPIQLENVPPNADVRTEIYAGGQLIWILHSRPSTNLVQLPPIFGINLTADVQLFAASIVVSTDPIPFPPHGEVFRYVTTTRDIPLRRR